MDTILIPYQLSAEMLASYVQPYNNHNQVVLVMLTLSLLHDKVSITALSSGVHHTAYVNCQKTAGSEMLW